MKRNFCALLFACLIVMLFVTSHLVPAQAETDGQTTVTPLTLNWEVVVNNAVVVPDDPGGRKFNSYNQPSININKVVVFRARSKAGKNQDGTPGEPAHGVWMRDMKQPELKTVFTRNTPVPQPNSTDMLFIEPPSFPRIDIWSNTIASRGNHQPVWQYLDGDSETRAGTTGIYTNPFGDLITGASNVGIAPDFSFFTEPGTGVKFDVFPGAPAVANSSTIVFKGNYTVGNVSKTGVYYRTLKNESVPAYNLENVLEYLSPAGGSSPAYLIANSDTLIPGSSSVKFGSTAPPSAAYSKAVVVGTKAVFAGFDNEDDPHLGGIYMAVLNSIDPKKPLPLTTLVKIGDPVPGETGAYFNRLGEGLSFDGRFVAFWGAWAADTAYKTLILQCPAEGNKERQAYCLESHPDGFEVHVPIHQGIFVIDITKYNKIKVIAKTPGDFDDFVYWNFSGLVPGTGESDETGEPARWRSATFAAVSGMLDDNLTSATFHAAFKARRGAVVNGAYENPVDGIYLRKGPGASGIFSAVVTGMDGTKVDPAAVYDDDENVDTPMVMLPVTEMGIERDGFRGNKLAINVSMGTEEAGFAGVYVAEVPDFTE